MRYNLSAIFGNQLHQQFEDIAKNAQKDFEDFAEALSIRLLQGEKDLLTRFGGEMVAVCHRQQYAEIQSQIGHSSC